MTSASPAHLHHKLSSCTRQSCLELHQLGYHDSHLPPRQHLPAKPQSSLILLLDAANHPFVFRQRAPSFIVAEPLLLPLSFLTMSRRYDSRVRPALANKASNLLQLYPI